MNYYFEKNKYNVVFTVFILISIISMTITTTSIHITIKSVVGMVVFPFIKAYDYVVSTIFSFFNSLNELRDLRKQVDALNLQIQDLKEQKYNYKILLEENKELRSLLALHRKMEFNTAIARIVSKDPLNLYSVLIIDKGKKHDLVPGMAVFTIYEGEKIAVGKIIETSSYYSKVMTIFDSRSFVSVKESFSNYSGIAVGRAPDTHTLVVEYFPNEAEIFFKDKFVTSGYGSIFPEGFVLGTVLDVQKQTYSMYQKIILNPILTVSKLNYVFIILEENKIWQ